LSLNSEPKLHNEVEEISLVEILNFFIRNIRWIGIITIIVSVIMVVFPLLQPVRYTKKITLSVQSFPSTGLRDISSGIFLGVSNPLGPTQISQLTTEKLQTLDLDQVDMSSRFDPTTQYIYIDLKSQDPDALTGEVAQRIRKYLEVEFQALLNESISLAFPVLDIQLQKNKQIMDQLDQQIGSLSSSNLARLESLENQRAIYSTAIAALEFDRRYWQEIKNSSAEVVSALTSVQVLTESDIQKSSTSFVQVLIVSAIAGFVLATVSAIVREQAVRLIAKVNVQEDPVP